METRKKSLGRRIREEKTSYLMLLPNLIMFVVSPSTPSCGQYGTVCLTTRATAPQNL